MYLTYMKMKVVGLNPQGYIFLETSNFEALIQQIRLNDNHLRLIDIFLANLIYIVR